MKAEIYFFVHCYIPRTVLLSKYLLNGWMNRAMGMVDLVKFAEGCTPHDETWRRKRS